MNNKGFTLVELLAVIVLIVVISLITFPNLNNLRKNNDLKEFNVYKDMMIEYTKVIPNYKNIEKGYVCLNEIKQFGLKDLNSNMTCNGYVLISDNELTPYLKCLQNNVELYKSDSYEVNKCE